MVKQNKGKKMLIYKAMYKYLDDAIHAEVLDFPGAISCGRNLQEARRMLASALVDMAETNLLNGEPLPQPNPNCTDPEADLEEPIYLLLKATARVAFVRHFHPGA
jgi:predicted RNase H-like HicB family nuclease